MTAEANLAGATIQSVDSLREAKLSVQADKDKQFFFDDNQGTVTLPFTFAYLPYNDEEVWTFSTYKKTYIQPSYSGIYYTYRRRRVNLYL